MTNPWQVLGIKPTEDKKTVKRAYTKLIKVNKPDTNPDEFSKIREAYEHCCELIDNNLVDTSVEQTVSDIEQPPVAIERSEKELLTQKGLQLAEDFKEEFHRIIDKTVNIDPKKWTKELWQPLTTHQALENFDARSHLSEYCFYYINNSLEENEQDRSKNMPKVLVIAIADLFYWKDNQFDNCFLNEVLEKHYHPETYVAPIAQDSPESDKKTSLDFFMWIGFPVLVLFLVSLMG